MNNIIPSSDLRNKYQEVSKFCKKTRQPIYITVNGRGDTVLLSLEEYKELENLKMARELTKSEEESKVVKTAPMKKKIAELKKIYNL